MRYIITAGGTGGHIYPAISIINKIKEMDKNSKFLYIGTTDRMEKDIIPNLNIDYVGINMCGLSKNPIKLLKFGKNMLLNVNKCKKIIKEFKPDIVIGVGGYVTAPVIIASSKMNVPSILHEQNSVPGKANRFLSSYATKICISIPSSSKYFDSKKIVFTGNPRSEEIINTKKGDKKDYDLSLEKKLVLITTGSLGSSTINEKIVGMLNKFKDKSYEVLLVTGKSSYNDVRYKKVPSNVHVVSYVDNMGSILKYTDLIISRAGATIISEITALGIPSILIPSPFVPYNHQYLNALYLKENDACFLMEEKDFNEDLLLEEIDKIMSDKVLYNNMKNKTKKIGVVDSCTKIYKVIEETIKEK